ncbi:MAG TPA: ATP-binding protein [Streptosporangiaceae bacterium]|nr:ATP-binding protein [Streptosporangiaceae bacterium]
MVVSELVTNSVAASAELRLAAATVLVWLGSDSRCVLLAVADASPKPPVRLSLEPEAEGGRGLALVETLSSRWGWHLVSIAGLMKVVWAEWRLPSGVGQRSATGLPDGCHAV